MRYFFILLTLSAFPLHAKASDSCLTKFYMHMLTRQSMLHNFYLVLDSPKSNQIVFITFNHLRAIYDSAPKTNKSFVEFGIEMITKCDMRKLKDFPKKYYYQIFKKDKLYKRLFAMKEIEVLRSYTERLCARMDTEYDYRLILAYFFKHQWVTLESYCPDYYAPHAESFNCKDAF